MKLISEPTSKLIIYSKINLETFTKIFWIFNITFKITMLLSKLSEIV